MKVSDSSYTSICNYLKNKVSDQIIVRTEFIYRSQLKFRFNFCPFYQKNALIVRKNLITKFSTFVGIWLVQKLNGFKLVINKTLILEAVLGLCHVRNDLITTIKSSRYYNNDTLMSKIYLHTGKFCFISSGL